MKFRNQRLLVVAAAWFALVPFAASATPITYEFSVTATSGPFSGTTANGSFTFDSSSIPATLPGAANATGLLTALNFTWNGITYNFQTANTGSLLFDGSGNLSGAIFGTNCFAGLCRTIDGQESWYAAPGSNGFTFSYVLAQGGGPFRGTTTLGSRVTVHEPAADLLVSSEGTNQILRYNGSTGAFIDAFVAAGSGGLASPHGLVFGPDGDLYVSSYGTNQILRYNGSTGAFQSAFVTASNGGLVTPVADRRNRAGDDRRNGASARG